MLSGFKTFVMRGNVVDLAVAVVIGAAFSRVVDALVQGLINPLIAALFGQADLSEVWAVQLGSEPEPTLRFGLLLDAALQFLLVAAAIYFLIVLPLNTLAARRKAGVEPEPAAPAEDVLLLTEIRDLLAARREP
ncbi:large conductance mechanosensitive channel protein MscL [Actinotalea sp. K2]|uniref:large conductance mechanosensitive channel protein MscL n=1 Tax=Actinotalea sp. K2 TaxID=2939438 RepID=UPI00201745B4|nr:large conductance mechanosensitive channel protein MscL [Actinotalea sp. K2]MCL3861251.1 large conductance mechanosensitive channel protein MscL [Actinotalea sp. K2]